MEVNNEERSPLMSRNQEPIVDEEFLLPGEKEPLEPISIWRLIALSICFLGVQFGWAIQIAYTSPLFLELGVPSVWVSFVWLAGPISGLLVQPTVGVVSDRLTSRWGRRRPFIFFGTISIVIGMLLISNASSIGVLFGDTKVHNPIAITIAIVGFWVLDLSNNTVQGPCRALLVDIAPVEQHSLGSSMFSIMLGIGNLVGYFAGSLKLTKWLPFFRTDLRALFTIGIFTLVTCVMTTVVFTKEKPISKKETGKAENPFVKIAKGLWNMPVAMQRVCAVQFFTWIGWFTFFLYATVWVAEDIYGGDANAPEGSEKHNLFQEGVRWGSLGLMLEAAVTIVVSVIVPHLAHVFGIKLVYSAGLLVFAVCLILPIVVKSKIGALILIAACGIPWSVVMIFPFALVGMSVDEKESGMYMGVLNIFVVMPQILVSVSIGLVIKIFGGKIVSALAVGGVSSIVAAILCWFLIIRKETTLISINGPGGGH